MNEDNRFGLTETFRSFIDLSRELAGDFRDVELQHQVVALYVKGSRLVGYGVNQLRHAHLMSYFGGSLHAEADLIRRYGDKLRGAKIFLYRYNNAPSSPHAGRPMCARPCLLCGHLLRNVGIRRVVYLNEAGEIESRDGHELPLLTEEPAILTKLFLNRAGQHHHGKFMAAEYLA